jgi:hypothetical protein
MEQVKSFVPQTSDLSKSIEFVKQYYTVQGYSILYKSSNHSHCFVMKKDSLYRQLIGMVPIVAILWVLKNGQVEVSTLGYMEHSINADLNKIIEKLFDISGIGISRKISNYITDPLFKKTLTEEAMIISEGALTSMK